MDYQFYKKRQVSSDNRPTRRGVLNRIFTPTGIAFWTVVAISYLGDRVRVKVVSLNLASASMLDSRIGLNMKQLGLGKVDWLYQVKKEKVK